VFEKRSVSLTTNVVVMFRATEIKRNE